MRKYKTEILIGLLIWTIVGVIAGGMDSLFERSNMDYVDGKYVRRPKSGCVYKSIASFTNLGYFASCELFRNRFEIEGVGN